MKVVTTLDKDGNAKWTAQEIASLIRAGAEVEQYSGRPDRLVITKQPSRYNYRTIIGHTDWKRSDGVDIEARWV